MIYLFLILCYDYYGDIMNNKGFTLIELIISVDILAFITLIGASIINESLSISDEKAAEIMEKNIQDASRTYIIECSNGLIDCKSDYVWIDNKTSFPISYLSKYGYFYYEQLEDPVTKQNVSNCLMINVVRDEYSNYTFSLDKSNC